MFLKNPVDDLERATDTARVRIASRSSSFNDESKEAGTISVETLKFEFKYPLKGKLNKLPKLTQTRTLNATCSVYKVTWLCTRSSKRQRTRKNAALHVIQSFSSACYCDSWRSFVDNNSIGFINCIFIPSRC